MYEMDWKDITTTANAPSTSECTLDKLKEVIARVAELKPSKYSRLRLSHQTLDALCAIFAIEERPYTPGAMPEPLIYGLEVVFDEAIPFGRYKLE